MMELGRVTNVSSSRRNQSLGDPETLLWEVVFYETRKTEKCLLPSNLGRSTPKNLLGILLVGTFVTPQRSAEQSLPLSFLWFNLLEKVLEKGFLASGGWGGRLRIEPAARVASLEKILFLILKYLEKNIYQKNNWKLTTQPALSAERWGVVGTGNSRSRQGTLKKIYSL